MRAEALRGLIGKAWNKVVKRIEFYDEIDAVEKAGFRACKRCQPQTAVSPYTRLVQHVVAFLVNHYRERLVLRDIADIMSE